MGTSLGRPFGSRWSRPGLAIVRPEPLEIELPPNVTLTNVRLVPDALTLADFGPARGWRGRIVLAVFRLLGTRGA